jgi:sugar phosphate isomerase/epimerase
VSGAELEVKGDLTPQNLSQTGRRELRHLLSSNNLEASALYCPLRRGLDVAENQAARIDYLKEVLSLSFDLGPRIVIVQAGKVPEKEDDPRFLLMHDALEALARHGDRSGATLALDTGLESGEALKRFLDRFDTAGLSVNFNPANLLVAGFNPYEAARALGRRIVHAIAQDARSVSPNRLQTVLAGHGDIEWMQMLATFEEIEYKGFLIVPGEDVAELNAGVSFLRRLMGQ